MTSDAAQILSHIPNSAIVQLPGRRFPGIVMAFAVENAPGGRLFAFTHPGTGLIGTVEERDCAGTWSDVLLPEPNDEFVLASNAHSHFHFFFLPGDRKVHKPRATERELVQAALDARSPDVIS